MRKLYLNLADQTYGKVQFAAALDQSYSTKKKAFMDYNQAKRDLKAVDVAPASASAG